MKKTILSVGLVLLSLNGFAQSGGLGGSTSPIDSSNNPSGVGFGGALGGATNPSTTPSNTSTPTSTVPATTTPGFGTTSDQQRMEDNTNFAGGSMGGGNVPTTTTPAAGSTLPSGTGTITTPPTQPTNIPRSTSPSGTGVGTGSPATY